jgi:hypothetical protein
LLALLEQVRELLSLVEHPYLLKLFKLLLLQVLALSVAPNLLQWQRLSVELLL